MADKTKPAAKKRFGGAHSIAIGEDKQVPKDEPKLLKVGKPQPNYSPAGARNVPSPGYARSMKAMIEGTIPSFRTGGTMRKAGAARLHKGERATKGRSCSR